MDAKKNSLHPLVLRDVKQPSGLLLLLLLSLQHFLTFPFLEEEPICSFGSILTSMTLCTLMYRRGLPSSIVIDSILVYFEYSEEALSSLLDTIGCERPGFSFKSNKLSKKFLQTIG